MNNDTTAQPLELALGLDRPRSVKLRSFRLKKLLTGGYGGPVYLIRGELDVALLLARKGEP